MPGVWTEKVARPLETRFTTCAALLIWKDFARFEPEVVRRRCPAWARDVAAHKEGNATCIDSEVAILPQEVSFRVGVQRSFTSLELKRSVITAGPNAGKGCGCVCMKKCLYIALQMWARYVAAYRKKIAAYMNTGRLLFRQRA